MALQWSTSTSLSSDTAAAVREMLRRNMQQHYGVEWPAEWRRKQRNVLHRNARHECEPWQPWFCFTSGEPFQFWTRVDG